jgi:hypothetical protein
MSEHLSIYTDDDKKDLKKMLERVYNKGDSSYLLLKTIIDRIEKLEKEILK